MSDLAKKTLFQTTASELFSHEMSRQETRKLQIIEASVKLFAEKGFDEVSFDLIAKKCKVTRPLVNHYFKSKLEIFMLAARYVRILYQKKVIAEMSVHKEPKALFKAYLVAAIRWHHDEPLHARVWVLYYYMSSLDQNVRQQHAELVDLGTQRIVEMLKMLGSEKKYSETELFEQARLIQMIITGTFVSEASENRSEEQRAFLRDMAFRSCCRVAGLPE